jgi:hypothetical protein
MKVRGETVTIDITASPDLSDESADEPGPKLGPDRACKQPVAPHVAESRRSGWRAAPPRPGRSTPRPVRARSLAWGLLAVCCITACSVDDRALSVAGDTEGEQQTLNASTPAGDGTEQQGLEANQAGAAPESAPGVSDMERDNPSLPPASAEDSALSPQPRECEPGGTRCSSPREVAECGADGAWAAPVACTNVCSDGACAGECVPGQSECQSTVRYRTCSEQGTWSAPAECENACVGGACAGQCRPAQTRCSSTVDVQTCNDQGDWAAPAACENACAADACTGECSPGATRCASETDLQTCSDGGQWQPPAGCEFACVDGACGGECSPGDRRCSPSSGFPQYCSTEGIWQSQEPCPFVCSGSGTCGGECSPGDRRCNPNGVTPQVCGDDSLWQNGDRCEFVCSGAGQCTGECSPGDRRCNPSSGVPQRCSQDGEWQDQSACISGQSCEAGECRGCQDDRDCRLLTCGCSCGVIRTNEPDPPCDRFAELCLVAPCQDRFALCVEGACVLE